MVLPNDDAIDPETSDMAANAEALYDFSAGHIKIKEGCKPTLFKIGPLFEKAVEAAP